MLTSPWPLSVGDVLLREAAAADIDSLLRLRNHPQVNTFMVVTGVELHELRRQWTQMPASSTDFSCVGEIDGQLVAIGFLELADGTGQPGMPTGTQASIGYLVDPDWWGQGIASNLARGLLIAAFEHLRVRRVTAGCYADNHASARVLAKIGMRQEQHGVQDSWHATRGWVDGLEFALLAQEWQQLPDRDRCSAGRP